MKSILIVALIVPLFIAPAAFAAQDAYGQAVVNTAARVGAKQVTVCVPTGTPVALPTSALTNRKAVAFQNNGNTDVMISFDPTHAPSNSGVGWRIPSGTTSAAFDVSELGTTTTVKAVAKTSDQTTPNCTEVLELR